VPALSPHHHPHTLAKLDGRTKEARLLRRIREELVAHVGGSPSPPQRLMIERAASLSLRIALMDQKFTETGTTTDVDARSYLAWSNTLTRLMRHLGLKGASQQPPSLQDYLAAKTAA
jgi:hypothetical protein